MRIKFLLSILLMSLFTYGCIGRQDVKNSWKFTTKQYRTYLNKPAKLDMEYTPTTSDYENVLVESVFEIDRQIEKLVRAMENSSKDVGEEWVFNMMDEFPWLSGVALVNNLGDVVSKYPDFSPVPLDFKPLIAEDPKQSLHALRTHVNNYIFGTEIYIASPVYIDQEFRGLVVAHFNPKSLLTYSPDPGIFMVASPSGILWAGDFGGTDNPIAEAEWERILLNNSKGYMKKDNSEFYWIARYIGNLPIVYALPVDIAEQAKS